MSEWISIKDRLPELEGRYLVYTDNKTVELAEWNGHLWTWYSDDVSYGSGYTHWRELPDSPRLSNSELAEDLKTLEPMLVKVDELYDEMKKKQLNEGGAE